MNYYVNITNGDVLGLDPKTQQSVIKSLDTNVYQAIKSPPLPTQKWDSVKKVFVDDINMIKQAKIDEINKACGAAITGGFVSNALGTKHLYDSQLEDQLNLVGAAGAGIDLPYSCTDVGTGVKAEVLHTVAQIKQVYADGIAFKQAQLSKCRQLKAQVQNATTVAAVNKIKW